MNHDTIMQLARDAAGGMLSHDAEGFCSLTGPEIVRFAESLVKECSRIASDADLTDVEGGDSDVLRAASEQIRKHFGVE